MADGTFALLGLVLGLSDMASNHCPTSEGCLRREAVAPRFTLSGGQVLEREAQSEAEIYLRYAGRQTYGPFGTAVGFSASESGTLWFGIGATYRVQIAQVPIFAELHLMPGYYHAGDGLDLGGPLEFRSGISFGVEDARGWRYAFAYDHRSNAGIFDKNPGVETVQFSVSVPLR